MRERHYKRFFVVGEIKVNRVFAAVDCGFAIDPPNVRHKCVAAINDGLSAALYGKVDIDGFCRKTSIPIRSLR